MKPSREVQGLAGRLVGAAPFALWLALLVAAPLATAVLTSVQVRNGPGFTMAYWQEILSDPLYRTLLWRSLLLSTVVAALAVVLVYPIAYLAAFRTRRARTLLILLSVLPLWVSYLVRLIAWKSLLGTNGVINSLLLGMGVISEPLALGHNRGAVAVVLVSLCIPFVFIPLFTVLDRIPRNLLDAAADLGADGWTRFCRVIVPISLPGVVTAFIFAFTIALGDYIVPREFGGTDGMLFGNLVWSQFGPADHWPRGAALGCLLLVMTLAALALAHGGSRQRRGGFLV